MGKKKNKFNIVFLRGKAVVYLEQVKKETIFKKDLVATLRTMKNLPIPNNDHAEQYTNFILDNLGMVQHVISQKILMVSKNTKRPYVELTETKEGEVEWTCTHGVGHTVYAYKRNSLSHKCCVQNCCKALPFVGPLTEEKTNEIFTKPRTRTIRDRKNTTRKRGDVPCPKTPSRSRKTNTFR